jgi:hypothetical protein
MADWDEGSAEQNRTAGGMVIHRIAHHWASDDHFAYRGFAVYTSLSGAASSYTPGSVLYDPGEDWANTWEAYFGYRDGGTDGIYISKEMYVGFFFEDFRSKVERGLETLTIPLKSE